MTEAITTTSDQFIMIQGYAGTGKTTMTRSAIDTIKHAQSMTHEEVELIAVAPTHQAVKEMRALGIEAQTLKSFLIEQEQEPTLSKKTLVLLDESSMVSNRDCANLMQKIHHSRVLWKKRQKCSIWIKNAFYSLFYMNMSSL
jgi:ATP-dependent exoDNAse (exonuclease V) alpha subunit